MNSPAQLGAPPILSGPASDSPGPETRKTAQGAGGCGGAPSDKTELAKRAWLPALILAAAVPVGLLLLGAFGRAASETPALPVRRILFYQDSMHPWIKSEQPGKCTICGMDLTPIYEGEQGKDLGGNLVALSSNAITVLNVQTEELKRQPLARTLRVAGTLEPNETKKRIVAAPAAGRIDELAVDYTGVEVREGQPLVTFYSPALTQDKLRFLVRTRHMGQGQQRDPSGNLAKELDADPYYSDLLAPQGGTILERNVTKGQYVAEGEKLFTIADASVLWFRFDVYEQQLPWLRRGQKIEVRVPALPGKSFTAVISFIEPMLNEATRTIKVRAEIPNPLVETDGQKERLLRFGMYAEGVFRAEIPKLMTVPGTAILYPGSAAYAYVDKGNGAYERRQVRLGREGNGSWEVLEGLVEGDRVVVSGNVLLDAQAQFNKGRADQIGNATELAAAAVQSDAGSAIETAPTVPAHSVAASTAGPATQADLPGSDGGLNHGAMDSSQAQVTPLAKAMSMPTSVAAKEALASLINTNGVPSPSGAPRSPLARAKARKPTPQAPGPGLSAGNMLHMQLMDSWRDRHAAELLQNPPSLTKARLSQSQCESLQAFLTTADGIAHALATDDLTAFNGQLTTLSNQVADLQQEFVVGDSWKGHVQHFRSAADWLPAKDLTEARARFLPFTINVVDLGRRLKKQEPAFAGLKFYHCQMAPAPGMWMQLKGPLLNPFFGVKMQTCGQDCSEENDQLALGAKEEAGRHMAP